MSPSLHDAAICLSLETWNDLVVREFARPPDRMVQHLRTSEAVGRLLVANPWRSVFGQVQRRLGPGRDAAFPSDPRTHLMRPMRLRRADAGNPGSVRRSYAAYSRLLRLNAARHGLQNPVLITFNPLIAAYGDNRGFRSVTYVGRDDWASYPPHRHLWDVYLDAYRRIGDKAVRVSAVSEVLMERIAPTAEHRVVPNGVDPEIWRSPGPKPDRLRELAGPIAMYTGTVDERLSLDAFDSLARALAGGTVVVVGPQHGPTAERLVRANPNVVLIPSVGQRELAALVSAADVCVVPHVNSALTQAMSPLKIYEYLAAGKPVAATSLRPIAGIDPRVVLAESDAQFGAATLVALQAGPAPEDVRTKFLEDNSWDSRCQQILELALA